MADLRIYLERIMEEYSSARSTEFAEHTLSRLIRYDIPDYLMYVLPEYSEIVWEGSAGKGQWADAPWLAGMHQLVTDTPQNGFYLTYLFTRTLDAVYLSINQGITILRRDEGTKIAREILKHRAHILLARGKDGLSERLSVRKIDLQAKSSSDRLALYEPGHAFGIKYERHALPTNDVLINDLRQMIDLYELVLRKGGSNEFSDDVDKGAETSKDVTTSLEEKRHRRLHLVIERNQSLAKKAKKYHGYKCKVCGFDFEAVYGDLGKEYIEAHHLIPLSKLDSDVKSQLSPKDDFTVVCANCHRIIHRDGAPETFEEFVRLYRAGR